MTDNYSEIACKDLTCLNPDAIDFIEEARKEFFKLVEVHGNPMVYPPSFGHNLHITCQLYINSVLSEVKGLSLDALMNDRDVFPKIKLIRTEGVYRISDKDAEFLDEFSMQAAYYGNNLKILPNHRMKLLKMLSHIATASETCLQRCVDLKTTASVSSARYTHEFLA